MSQSGIVTSGSSASSDIELLTGNSGGAVGPDGAFNVNLLGSNVTGINIVGNAGTNTLTVSGIASSETQVGTIELATNAESQTGTDTTRAIVPSSLTYRLERPGPIGSVTPGAGTFTTLTANGFFTAVGGHRYSGVAVIAGDYVVTSADYYLVVTNTGAVRTITFPNVASALNGQTWLVKDLSGGAATNNISLVVDGGATIDGAASYSITQNYGSVFVVYIGTANAYFVY